jgi:hypothetical protein
MCEPHRRWRTLKIKVPLITSLIIPGRLKQLLVPKAGRCFQLSGFVVQRHAS